MEQYFLIGFFVFLIVIFGVGYVSIKIFGYKLPLILGILSSCIALYFFLSMQNIRPVTDKEILNYNLINIYMLTSLICTIFFFMIAFMAYRSKIKKLQKQSLS
jgi:hypothetical protein